jgi:hypothetical protein
MAARGRAKKDVVSAITSSADFATWVNNSDTILVGTPAARLSCTGSRCLVASCSLLVSGCVSPLLVLLFFVSLAARRVRDGRRRRRMCTSRPRRLHERHRRDVCFAVQWSTSTSRGVGRVMRFSRHTVRSPVRLVLPLRCVSHTVPVSLSRCADRINLDYPECESRCKFFTVSGAWVTGLSPLRQC